MKISVQHDGNGGFRALKSESGASRDEEGLKLMLSQVAEAVGQSLLYSAGLRGRPLGICTITLEGCDDLLTLHTEGLDVTIEAKLSEDILNKLVTEALKRCFPQGSAACPVRQTIIVSA